MNLQLINVIISFALCFFIWFIQLVHYPFFAYIDSSRFQEAMLFHQHRISLLIAPLMIGDILVKIYLAIFYYSTLYTALLLTTLIIWTSTFCWQVPLHHKLSHTFDKHLILKLIRSNWLRTILWTVNLVIIFFN